jgi:hypothetical protein
VSVDAWKALEEFVTTEIGKPPIGQLHLARDTDLYHDLDMTSAHIARLLDAWAVKFEVDMAGFDLHDYYPSEKLGIRSFIGAILRSPFSPEAREVLGGRALTLGMLEDAMCKGRWENS